MRSSLPLKFLLLVLGSFAFAQPIWATTSSDPQVPATYTTCLQCHADSQGGNPIGPNIAGQQAWYLEKQLRDFKSGVRGAHAQDALGQQMAAISQTIADDMISPLALYIATLTPKVDAVELSGNLKNGYRYYHARCGACHGSEGQGDETFKAPNLRVLSPDYLMAQMANFSSDKRGTDSADRLGRQMNMMSKVVTEQELKDIVFFLQQ